MQYRTIIKGTREHRLESSLALFIEPADGSAADIDPESLELNGLPASPESSVVGDAAVSFTAATDSGTVARGTVIIVSI